MGAKKNQQGTVNLHNPSTIDLDRDRARSPTTKLPMKPYTNPLPAPPPSAQRPFDPWNSSSTGHQRREASRRETDGVSETAWRAARTAKLNRQFQTQERVLPPPPLPDSKPLLQRKSVAEMLAKPGSMNSVNSKQSIVSDKADSNEQRGPRLFTGIVVYVNGSTAPLVSDHHLKTTLVAHGARVALHLARRQVTHVVLGRPAGGLAGTKKDKEIRRRGGCGIKYVGVEWCVFFTWRGEYILAGKDVGMNG